MDTETFEQYYELIFQISGGDIASLDEIIWINNELTPLFQTIMDFKPRTKEEEKRRAELLHTLKIQMGLLYANTLSFLLINEIETEWQDTSSY